MTLGDHLIPHITSRLAAGQPLTSLKLEELKIIKLVCIMVFKVFLVALPIMPVNINPLHLFSPSPATGSQNIYTKKTKTHDRPKVTIKKMGAVWTVRALIENIRWERRKRPDVELGYTFIAPLIINTDSVRLSSVDALEQQTCSDQNTSILKAETPDSLFGRGGPIRVFLQNNSVVGPPPAIMLQFYLYANGGAIVMRHNPLPYLDKIGDNGFMVKSPKNIKFFKGQKSTLTIHNGYDAMENFVAVFIPLDIKQLNVSGGIWRPRSNLTITIEAVESHNLKEHDAIGTIYFFPEDFFTYDVLGNTRPSMQLSTHISIESDTASDDDKSTSVASDDSDSDMDSGNVKADTGDDSEDDEDDDGPKTPPVLTQAAFNYAVSKYASPRTAEFGESVTVRWTDWNIRIPAHFLTPVRCKVFGDSRNVHTKNPIAVNTILDLGVVEGQWETEEVVHVGHGIQGPKKPPRLLRM